MLIFHRIAIGNNIQSIKDFRYDLALSGLDKGRSTKIIFLLETPNNLGYTPYDIAYKANCQDLLYEIRMLLRQLNGTESIERETNLAYVRNCSNNIDSDHKDKNDTIKNADESYLLQSPSKGYINIKNHTEQKWYHCKYCNYKCTRSHNLIVHERIHTGERPCQCKHCERKFITSGNLTTHIKKLHREKDL